MYNLSKILYRKNCTFLVEQWNLVRNKIPSDFKTDRIGNNG